MTDWKTKLDAFLQLNDGKILTHAGKISAEMAKELALLEYVKFDTIRKAEEAADSEKELRDSLSKLMISKESSVIESSPAE
jgi:hypothetical protein